MTLIEKILNEFLNFFKIKINNILNILKKKVEEEEKEDTSKNFTNALNTALDVVLDPNVNNKKFLEKKYKDGYKNYLEARKAREKKTKEKERKS